MLEQYQFCMFVGVLFMIVSAIHSRNESPLAMLIFGGVAIIWMMGSLVMQTIGVS